MPKYLEGDNSARGLRFGIVVSRFNEFITERLLEGALQVLVEHGADLEQVQVARVPGAFEIPLVAKKMALSRQYDAVICLGAVIRGETPHFEYISAEVSSGIARTALETGIPILFGVLTTETVEQAMERAGHLTPSTKDVSASASHRGRQAALAAVEMANLMKQFKF
ncbi:MAG TPA: 6,7-dimethyl-8-ribityllumazine synthase [Nitrospiria bacterium]|nr:6,7-dimethyl-8-ribityllumazine synthase [Nitrospiria bacterium]